MRRCHTTHNSHACGPHMRWTARPVTSVEGETRCDILGSMFGSLTGRKTMARSKFVAQCKAP
jgi:hypothetical protein